MKNFLDWAMSLFGLDDDYEADELEGNEAAPEAEIEPKEKSRPRFKAAKAEKSERAEAEKKPRDTGFSFASKSTQNTYQSEPNRKSKVVNMSGVSASGTSYGGLNMVIQQPSSFSDAPIIAKYLKDRQPVVVNLENVDKITAQKIVDFLGGAVYALDGRLSKVANGIVVAVPSNMGITGFVKDDFSTDIFGEIDF
jgi:cell division inhibitor SepF